MTDEGTTRPGHAAPRAMLPIRLRVFVPAMVLLVLAAAGLCLLVAVKTRSLSPELLTLWYSVMAGPFSARWILPGQSDWTALGAINLAVLFAHPVWPRGATAALTVLAFASWFFWGMAVSFSGV